MYYNDVKQGYRGKSYTIDDVEDKNRNPPEELDLIRMISTHGKGLHKELIHYGPHGCGNSGFQAINLAYLLGAKTVLLLGFDMFGQHYFGKHPKELVQNSPYHQFLKAFDTITEVEIINCTRQTALTCFPQMSLESVLSSELAPA